MPEPEVTIKTSELIKIYLDLERKGKEFLTIEEAVNILREIEASAKGSIQ